MPRAAACITGRKKPNPIIPPLYAASPLRPCPYVYSAPPPASYILHCALHAGFTRKPLALAATSATHPAKSTPHGPNMPAWVPCQKPGPAALQRTHGYAKSMPCVHPCYYGVHHTLPPPRRPA
ncbi:hypothetical protein [Acetobacter pomorum]|uniref:hypothetical protein n=1 Tax=Acetobacter pomorum TaxID=65959 RepID=UPI001606D447|nr:hypothetical protein [Acetobacter pomorum]